EGDVGNGAGGVVGVEGWGVAVAVADGVGEGGRAVVVGVRRESDVAAGEAHRAVDRAADAGDAQGVAVDVGVVGEQRARRDHQGRVLGGGGRVVDRDRGVVDGADGDVGRDRESVGGGGGGGRVGVVGVRRESDVAAGEAHRAVDRAADAGDAQGVAVDVGVVGEQRARRDHQGRVLGGGGRVVDRDRGVVDGADGDVD